ncbi:MAG: iron-sulfur cluster assembly accessory protein [Pseudomonadota bacterium]
MNQNKLYDEQKNITVTENAAKYIKNLIAAEQQSDICLKIIVEGGGCSGFQYKYIFPEPCKINYEFINQDIDAKPANSDILFFFDKQVILAIDPISASLMKDSKIDFVETLGDSSFEITNPNSVARCGCGNSFAM